jgi:hypothetical protein
MPSLHSRANGDRWISVGTAAERPASPTPRSRTFNIVLVVMVGLCHFASAAIGEESGQTNANVSLPTAADPLQQLPPDEARQVLQWAADWVRQVLPASYHGEKDWGKKTRVHAGVKVDMKDGRLTTHKRYKELGHGRWIRYDVHLHNPADPGRLDIRVTRAEQGPDQRIHFDAQIDTLLDLDVHQERWNLGTRLFSVSLKGQARLRMLISGDIGMEFDLTRIPPDILVDPRIVSTELVLVDLNVDRISKIGGEVADAVGDVIKNVIREEYLPKQQAAITTKLNRQIDRRRDRLRFGASEWISRSLPTP